MHNRVLILVFIASLFLSPLLGRLSILVHADPSVIIVPSTGITTIQQAINQSDSGDTILVQSGVYTENVVLNKSVTLKGANRDYTIVNGNFSGNVIRVTARGAAISNLTITGSGNGVNNDAGIRIEDAGENLLSDIVLTFNGDGIAAYNSENLIVRDNIIKENINNGVNLQSCTNSTVWRNTIKNNDVGIYIASGNNISASTNLISENANGIALSSSTGNIISGNTINSSQYGYGIWMIFSCSDNIIYHNNFRNTGNAYSELKNFWDYEGEGNYWSDYKGEDLNGDGIGDSPYNLTEASSNLNVDNYPLMGAFTELDFTYNGAFHVASVISNSSISNVVFQMLIETGDRMLQFKTSGSSETSGFCRVQLPNEAMSPPYIVSTDNEEITPTILARSNDTYTFLHFNFENNNNTVNIVASESLRLYNELLISYVSLRDSLTSLNGSYVDLMNSYTVLLDNFSQLDQGMEQLTKSYSSLLALNESTYQYIGYYLDLLSNFSQLQANYTALSNSYQGYLNDYAIQVQNLRNLMYIFATITAVFLVTTVYLSRRTYSTIKLKRKKPEQTTPPE